MAEDGQKRGRPERDWLDTRAEPDGRRSRRWDAPPRAADDRDDERRDRRDEPRSRSDQREDRRNEREDDRNRNHDRDEEKPSGDSKQDDGKPRDEKNKDKDKDSKKDEKQSKPLPLWPFLVAGLVVLVFVAVVLWIIFRPRPDVWTDDAYVTVHYASIAPRVSGQVATVPVDDNQAVKAGDVLATLDPRDYQTALAIAQAALQRDTAQVGDVSANVERQPANVAERQADVASAEARLGFAEADAKRFNNLATTGAGTQQQRQQADTTLAQSHAQLDAASAALDSARKQLDVLKAQQKAAEATVAADRAQVRQAELNLSYTRILAPFDGTVGERSVQVGNTVAPGATLMTVVPLAEAYIRANYREVDLIHVRAGQRVSIHVDAYDIDLDGRVDSVAPASGASFAPIQPNNATGNFTKIVQRLPVKIVVENGQPFAKLLKVGFSVETTIHTGLEDVVGAQRMAPSRITDH